MKKVENEIIQSIRTPIFMKNRIKKYCKDNGYKINEFYVRCIREGFEKIFKEEMMLERNERRGFSYF